MNQASTAALRDKWKIAFLLGIGVLINYFDRVNLSVSHEALYATFGISDITFGYLSAAYNWTYALCQLPIGVILDTFGVRRVGRISTFIWSIATFGAAITPNISGFFGARLLLGVGEAPSFPGNAKAIGLWFPQKERSLATAIFDSAAKLAPALGVPLLGIFLIRFGWRWSFAFTGLLSLFFFALFYFVYRDPDVPADAETDQPEQVDSGEPLSLWYLMRQKKVLGLLLGFGAYNYVFYLLLTWLPSYLAQSLHIDLLHSFLYTGAPWLFAAVTDIVVGGWLADSLIQRGWNADYVRRAILIGGTALGLGILGAAHTHSAPVALFWISISIGGLSAAAPIGWAATTLIAPRSSVGTLGGILNFSNQLSGIAAPIITGYLVYHRQSYAAAFGVAAAYLIVGIMGYWFLMGKIEPVPANL
ncbi:MFS transporter [Paracidobacterium acidisoli]|uniref:MFS transporter n=1 Tax=Paracidobacterium acidisoli TaxID=2303751 RepID=A0A372ITJ8_9BACT|nr:MFS transporter [Paracidobacterium acidisoli]MBT9329700.1 MFS transporter [Paracidobacterium acidisoli]